MPAQNMVITAIWAREEYTIRYIHLDLTETTETVLYHDLAPNPGYDPKAGYIQGWYEKVDGNITPFDFLTQLKGITIKYFENVTIDTAIDNANEIVICSNNAWEKDYNGEVKKYANLYFNTGEKKLLLRC